MPQPQTQMTSTVDTQEMVARPGCCATGDEYIRICEADAFYGPDRQGWALTLHRTEDPVRENVAHCPWCGKALPEL